MNLFLTGIAHGQEASEYQDKAAYLYNFAKLAQWPSQALPSDTTPLVIGVLGGDEEFVSVLQKIVAGKSAGTHPIVVKHFGVRDDLSHCQVVFFRSSEQTNIPAAVATLRESDSLLVGEDPAFLRDGGMINLVLDKGKIRFEVVQAALDRSNIRFSTTFLSRATANLGSPNQHSEGTRQILLKVLPVYPSIARQMNLKGSVQIEAVVGRNGLVQEVRVIGGHPLLAEALSRAVKQWKYEPSTKESTELVKYSFE